jgi:murein DD-endopeptidase MepM/ murein hydrolase activator NlpD
VAEFTGGMITGLTALALSACAPDELTTGPEATRQEDLPVAFDHGTFPTSTGIYRIPYVDGFPVTVGNDHHDHNPVNRIDMSGDVGGGVIVAAASGWIRGIVDRHGNSSSRGDGLSADGSTPHFDNLEHACQDDDVVVGDCTDYNNYVWIEHPNGEWTKYTHLSTGSVPNAYQVGDWVDAGDVLGTESDIGRATGPHLHHEVGLPDDPGDLTPFTELGGFMVGGFGINLVPRVCDIPDNLYESDESYTAGPCANVPPVANAGGPYTVAEGSTVQLDGTGSFDPDGLPLTFAWSPGRYLDDRLVASPIFNGEDDAVVDLDLTVYDQVEAIPAGDETTVTVTNVDPSVTIDASTSTTINEGQTLAVKATFSDPGLLDAPFTAEVVCRDVTGYGLTVDGTVSSVVVGASAITGAVDASCPFGDTSQSGNPPSGTFEVTVRVTDKDEGTGEASFDLTVLNVAPTPTIAMTGATSVNGMSTFLTQVGQPLDLSGNVTDPGSDDLFLTWDWDDGSVDNAGYRLLQLVPDPFPSPTSNPRNVTDPQSHVWSGACFYEISLSATDDDGGSSQDDANVIITGNSGRARGVGYWLTQYRGNRSKDFDQATLGCFLSITEYMSAVFNEVRAGTGSAAEAVDVLFVAGDMGDMSLLLDQQLLGVWLNFANGAFSWDDVVDTTGDGVPDTTLSAAVSAAEATRLDAGATRDALEAQMKALEAINLMHGG